MELLAKVVHVKDVKAGTGIGYGWTFVAPHDMRIATVSAGYADGYPRAQSNIGRVIIHGKYAPITGRVCMDQFMIDVSDIPETSVGDTVKTSAGAVFNVPICKVDHIKDAIFHLQGSGIKTVAATEKTDNNIYDIDFSAPVAIIMGNEERGVNPSVLKIVDEKAKLPMFGTIESLNVSVACGAFLYEVVRQRIG
jgi:hypothetical protein